MFELSGQDHSTYTTLVSFSGFYGNYPGSYPSGNLAIDGSGNIFGTTQQGGSSAYGTIFELSVDHQTYIVLKNLVESNGSPLGGVALDSSGNIYGTGNSDTGGIIFELHADHTTFQTLYQMGGPVVSNGIDSGLTIDGGGNLYGTTIDYGATGQGSIFELAANHLTFTTLVNFTGSTGNYPGTEPFGGLTLDASGDLWGTTNGSGALGGGTLFELAANRVTFTTYLSFAANSTSAGCYPSGNLYIDASGNVYGTTEGGGAFGAGTIFELSANRTIFKTLVNLSNTTGPALGHNAITGLVQGSDGNLYGETNAGGTYGLGSVFEIQSAGVADITATGQGITVGLPQSINGNRSEYFASLNAPPFTTISLSPTPSGHTALISGALSLGGSSGAWTGTIDLANNDLDLTSGSLSTLTDQVRQGFQNGTWSGAGITSSNAESDLNHLSGIGVMQNNQSGSALFNAVNPLDGLVPTAGDLLLKYTYYGDANLDGKVDGSDYTRIDSGYLTGSTGWYNGDFNYDGVVNGSDYTLIDNAFNRQGASLAAQVVPTSKASRLVSSAAQPTQYFSQTLSVLQSSWATPPNSIAAQLFSPDTRDLINHQKFSNLQILA